MGGDYPTFAFGFGAPGGAPVAFGLVAFGAGWLQVVGGGGSAFGHWDDVVGVGGWCPAVDAVLAGYAFAG